MRRGTTPTHIFTVPFPLININKVKLIYSFRGRQILVKTRDDLTLIGKDDQTEISFTLTQEETLAFYSDFAEIQMRILLDSGKVVASDIVQMPVTKILDESIL